MGNSRQPGYPDKESGGLKAEEIPFSASGGSTIVKLTIETNDVILLSLE